MSDARLDDLQRAVVLTLVYSDLFDHPLTAEELHRWLVLERAEPEVVTHAARSLVGARLWERDGCFGLAGREACLETRRRRAELSRPRWPGATRFAAWLGRVPFVRLAAVCGSQAVENGGDDGDVDFFLVADEGRLWIAQVATMALRRLAGRRLGHMCPNHLVTPAALDAGRRDLYTAREIVQAMPLWGEETYARFLAANTWVWELLPNTPPGGRRERLAGEARPRWTRGLERLLGGWAGETLDRALHRVLLLYYPLRLAGRGLRAEQLRTAYRRDRQLVAAGGYAPSVAASFRRRAREHLGDDLPEALLERLFPASPQSAPAHPVYDALFRERYGGSVV